MFISRIGDSHTANDTQMNTVLCLKWSQFRITCHTNHKFYIIRRIEYAELPLISVCHIFRECIHVSCVRKAKYLQRATVKGIYCTCTLHKHMQMHVRCASEQTQKHVVQVKTGELHRTSFWSKMSHIQYCPPQLSPYILQHWTNNRPRMTPLGMESTQNEHARLNLKKQTPKTGSVGIFLDVKGKMTIGKLTSPLLSYSFVHSLCCHWFNQSHISISGAGKSTEGNWIINNY